MRLLNAYYFRQHMYTLVPRHVRDDMAWMADVGTDVVSLAILEQDLEHARRNVDILCAEADRRGMRVHAVPARWGGIVAGAPKVPSVFAATHPETWVTDAAGRPTFTATSGPVASIYHPATRAFFAETIATLLGQWPIAGVVWDEPKVLKMPDHSPASPAHTARAFDAAAHVRACAAFFAEANRAARAARPDVRLSLFLQAHYADDLVEAIAADAGPLDDFGCDGRPWAAGDGGTAEANGKTLLDRGGAFLDAARRHGRRGLLLIENHNLATADYPLLDRRLPDVLALGPEQLIYYYFPRNLEDPERLMDIVAKHVRAWRVK